MVDCPKLRRCSNFLRATFVLALLTAFTANGVADDAAPLRWRFTEGESLDYAVLQQLDMMLKLNGAEVKIGTKMVFDITWTVDKVESNGTASITQKITRMQFDADSPFTGKVSVDSQSIRNGAELPPGPVRDIAKGTIEMLIDQEFKLTVGANGEVSDIVMPEKLDTELSKRGGGRNGQMGGLFGAEMSSDSVKQLIRRVVQRLPDDGVAADSAEWSQSFVVKMGPIGTQTSNVTYRYAGKEDGLDRINVETEVLLELSENGPAEVDMEILEQETDGHSFFDAKQGRLVSSQVVERLVLEGIFSENEIVRDGTSTLRVAQGNSEQFAANQPDADIKDADTTDANDADAKGTAAGDAGNQAK
ncbi:MAG: hypothetical protein KDA63_13455 [Planctomycetales bacterium]|nr:hypothetical protein [Planctomycetales bacterium]